MSANPRLCVVLTTVDSESVARDLARRMVEARLAACVQRTPISSCYEWEGKIEDAAEILLMVKTTVGRYPAVAGWLADHHPYDVPEVVMIPAGEAGEAYQAWVTRMTAPAGGGRPQPE